MTTTVNQTRPTTTMVTTSITTPRVAPTTVGTSGPRNEALGASSTGEGAQWSSVRMPAMYSLGMIAATLDNFNGANVGRYLQKFEQRAELDGWSEEETVKLLRFKCVGEACDFLNSDPTLAGVDFRTLKARLLARFQVSVLPGESQLNLSRCYQRHDESVASYCTRLRTLGAQVLREDLQHATAVEEPGIRKKNQDLILNQFKLGLRKDILREVGVLLLQERNLTLEGAEQIVSLHETTLKMLQGRNSNRPVLAVKCYTCGEEGHLSRQCDKSRGNPPEEGVCYLCQQRGHWARVCPNRRQGGEGFSQGERRGRIEQREVGAMSAPRTWENRDRDMGNRLPLKKVSWAGDQSPRQYKSDKDAYRNGREGDRQQFRRQGEDNRRQDVTDFRRQRSEEGRFREEERRYRNNGRRPEEGLRSINDSGRFYGNQVSSVESRNSGAIPKHGRLETNRVLTVEERSTRRGTLEIGVLNRGELPKKVAMQRLTDTQAFSKGEVDKKINENKELIITQPNHIVVTAQVHHSKDDVREQSKWVSSEEVVKDLEEIKVVTYDGDMTRNGGQENNSREPEQKGWIQKEIDKIWQSVKTLEQSLKSAVESKYGREEKSLAQGKRESTEIELVKPEEDLPQKISTQVETAHVAYAVNNNQEEVPISISNVATQEGKVRKGQELVMALNVKEEPEISRRKKITKKIDAVNDGGLEKGCDLHVLRRQNGDLFRKDDDILKSSQVKHKNSFEPGAKPLCKMPYRIRYKQQELLNDETERPKEKENLRPSWRPPDRLTNGRCRVRGGIDTNASNGYSLM